MPATPDRAADVPRDVAASGPLPTLRVPAGAPLGVAAAPATLSLPSAASAPRMDRDFIVQHQIVERYIGGRLPLKGAQDFEHYCRQHPKLLDEIALGDRINAALRLLDAGGRAPPWEQRPARWWEKLPAILALGGLCTALAITTLWTSSRLSAQRRAAQGLQQEMKAQALDPAQSTRHITIDPSRTAPSQRSLAVIGGSAAEFAELSINLSWSRYTAFDLTIDRVDQGRVAVLRNLQRDSNGQVQLALNSSALGPGDYQLTIEGITWRGEAVPQAWAMITIAH